MNDQRNGQGGQAGQSARALRDLAGNAELREAARVAMAVADAVQKTPSRGARLLGMTAAFLITSESAGIPVPDLMGMARNCMCLARGARPEFAAVEEFVKREVL